MTVKFFLAIIVFFFTPDLVEAAKCKVGDTWYDYKHPLCSGEKPEKRSGDQGLKYPVSTGVTIKSRADYSSDSQGICKEKWTKRGVLDSRMFNYCMRQQSEAYEDLRSLQKKYSTQKFYSEVAFPYCDSQWTKRGITDTRMLVYCLEHEVEGMKDVDNFRKQYGHERVNRIVADALGRYGSWKMVAYSLNRELPNQ
jgi:hypothetical protein